MDATVTGDGKAAVRRSADAWIPPIRRAPACGARTRAGGRCRAPAVRGKARCRMHGAAAGSGAQAGNRNALKHGYWSEAEAAERRRAAALAQEAARMLEEVAEGVG
jgi:glucans biosynthesis protein